MAGLVITKPFGVAYATLAFNTRGHHDHADAGGRGAHGNASEDYPVRAPGL
jgi:hypothetical protein